MLTNFGKCSSSSRYSTGLKAQRLMNKDDVLQAARKILEIPAKEAGSTRFCMGAAWRDTVGRKTNFNQILEYVKEIRDMGMEVCCTLGMIEKQQAVELKKAGLTAYNHNLDTSREYYPNIITTRSYDERLQTLEFVREAGISVCSGGIIGLGEAEEDRIGLLHTLSTLPTHPESVPINALVAVKGTPLQDQKDVSGDEKAAEKIAWNSSVIIGTLNAPVEIWEMIRMIATARIVMPKAMVRLSAGRVRFSISEQAMCFLAGANSIFTGEKLLTTPNNDFDADQQMFKLLGLIPKAPSFTTEAEDLEVEQCEAVLFHGSVLCYLPIFGVSRLIANSHPPPRQGVDCRLQRFSAKWCVNGFYFPHFSWMVKMRVGLCARIRVLVCASTSGGKKERGGRNRCCILNNLLLGHSRIFGNGRFQAHNVFSQ
ncbi:biotin synthase [Asimina triloba]